MTRALRILPALLLFTLFFPGHPAGATTVVSERFQLPSHDLGCVFWNYESVRCDALGATWQPAPPEGSCNPAWVRGLVLDFKGKTEFNCAGDTLIDPSVPVLEYGSSRHVGVFICTSTRDGVLCVRDGKGDGFLLSRGRYQIFEGDDRA